MYFGDEIACDVSFDQVKGFGPAEAVSGWDDEARGLECAFDFGPGVNLQRALGGQLAEQPALEDGFADDGIGVEEKAAFFDDEAPFGFEMLGGCVGDLIVPQVDVAAAPLAHG